MLVSRTIGREPVGNFVLDHTHDWWFGHGLTRGVGQALAPRMEQVQPCGVGESVMVMQKANACAF